MNGDTTTHHPNKDCLCVKTVEVAKNQEKKPQSRCKIVMLMWTIVLVIMWIVIYATLSYFNLLWTVLLFYCSVVQNILNNRIAGPGGNVAHVVVVSCHLDVPLVTPASAPTVLDQPVVLTILRPIPHYQHSVERATVLVAVLIIVHSTFISSKPLHVSIDHHGHWTIVGHSILKILQDQSARIMYIGWQ